MKKLRIAIPSLIVVPLLMGALSAPALAARQDLARPSVMAVATTHGHRHAPCPPGQVPAGSVTGGVTGNVGATAQASLLHNLPIIGPILAALPIVGPTLDALLTALTNALNSLTSTATGAASASGSGGVCVPGM